MGERQRSWEHSFACAWHDGEPCTCKDASDRPLTTGEGAALVEELREALDDPKRGEWGGYPWEHLGDAERDVRVLLAECGRLREQLDAARTQLGEVEYGLENLRGWWPDGKLAARQAWLGHIERHADAARAALGVEGPAG